MYMTVHALGFSVRSVLFTQAWSLIVHWLDAETICGHIIKVTLHLDFMLCEKRFPETLNLFPSQHWVHQLDYVGEQDFIEASIESEIEPIMDLRTW